MEQVLGRIEPQACLGDAGFGTYQNGETSIAQDGEGIFVGEVVAEKGDRGIGGNGFQYLNDGVAFVNISCTQFEASVELEQTEDAFTGAGCGKLTAEVFHAVADLERAEAAGCGAAPVDGNAAGFHFNHFGIEGLLKTLPDAFQALPLICGQFVHLVDAVSLEMFAAVAAPDFDGLGEVKQGLQFLGFSAADEDDAGPWQGEQAFEALLNAGIGDGFEAVGIEGREGAIVIEQEERCGCSSEATEELGGPL